jgi:hypothetical protein
MTRVLALLLTVPVFAVAAPVPPESDGEKVARLWGKVRVPSGPFAVKPEGNLLTLRTAGYPLPFEHQVPVFQVTREVAGDFDVRVKVFSLDSPTRGVYYNDPGPQTAAGLYIDGGRCAVALYRWKAYHKFDGVIGDAMQDSFWLSRRTGNGGAGSNLGEWVAGQSGYLRIVRKGDKFTAGTSADGKEWKEREITDQGLNLPPAVTVGLFLGHTTSQECAAGSSSMPSSRSRLPGGGRPCGRPRRGAG